MNSFHLKDKEIEHNPNEDYGRIIDDDEDVLARFWGAALDNPTNELHNNADVVTSNNEDGWSIEKRSKCWILIVSFATHNVFVSIIA